MNYDDYDFGPVDTSNIGQTGGSNKYIDSFNVKKFAEKTGIPRLEIVPDKEYVVDILPFPITERHPQYKDMIRRNPGKTPLDYTMSVLMHKVKGDSKFESKFVCPSKTFGKPCPFCEEKSRLFADGGFHAHPEEIKALNETRRDYFLVLNHEDGKVYLFYYYYGWFLENLEKRATRMSSPTNKIIPAYPGPNGHSVKFFGEAGKLKNKKTNLPLPGEIKDIEFLPRKEGIRKEILENLPSMDEFLTVYDYDTIASFLDGTYFLNDEEYTEEDVAPQATQQATPQVAKQEQVPEIPMDKEPEHIPSVGKPTEATRELTREERRAMRQAKSETPTCPGGGEFGKDLDMFDECDNCPVATACEKAYAELN